MSDKFGNKEKCGWTHNINVKNLPSKKINVKNLWFKHDSYISILNETTDQNALTWHFNFNLFDVKCFFLLLSLFFLSGSLMARIYLIRWISGVPEVRTPAPAYNNALSYQLSYAHGTYYYLFNCHFLGNCYHQWS